MLSLYNFTPNEWVDLVVDVSAHPPRMVAGAFNYQAVALVVLTLGTSSTFSGTGTIRVLVDSLTFSGVSGLEGSDLRATPLASSYRSSMRRRARARRFTIRNAGSSAPPGELGESLTGREVPAGFARRLEPPWVVCTHTSGGAALTRTDS